MSDKSSIHVRAVTSGSEKHNKRQKELSYVRSDLSHLNSSYDVQSIADAQFQAKCRYEFNIGQKMQAKATPIREGVLLISEHHTADDLKRLADRLEQRFGIRTIQAYCHKDEGHYDKETNEWKPNYHAHMVFDWTNEDTGKCLRLRKDELREMQTIVADEMGLERGKRSGKKHIEATAFKAMKVKEDLEFVYNVKKIIPDAYNVIKEAIKAQNAIEPLEEKVKSLESNKNTLEQQQVQAEQRLAELKKQIAKEKEELAKLQALKTGIGGGGKFRL